VSGGRRDADGQFRTPIRQEEQYELTRYNTGEEEIYNLERDPWQLRNLAGRLAGGAIEARLLRHLNALCEPPPPGLTI
jgi:hypothetical protein